MIQEMDEKTKEMLRGAGREMAVDLMESACTSAKDKKQMHNQMAVLSYLAKHILATMIYNVIRQQGVDEEMAIGMVLGELRKEFKWVKDQPDEEMVLSGPGPGEGVKNEIMVADPE